MINYSRGPLKINQELWNNSEEGSEELSMSPQLRYSKDSNYVGVQLDMVIGYDSTPAVKLGFLIGMDCEGWTKMFEDGWTPTDDRKPLYELCSIFWQLATGVVAASTTTDLRNGFILPTMDVEQLADMLALVPS